MWSMSGGAGGGAPPEQLEYTTGPMGEIYSFNVQYGSIYWVLFTEKSVVERGFVFVSFYKGVVYSAVPVF